MDQGWASIHRKKNLFPVKLPLVYESNGPNNQAYSQSHWRVLQNGSVLSKVTIKI